MSEMKFTLEEREIPRQWYNLAADLPNPTAQLDPRIDLILFRSSRISVNNVQLVGANPSDRLPSGQWPSDHAGVVGTLSIK